MAEGGLFGLASNLLIKIASPAFKEAYERVQSTKDDLDKLEVTIHTIQGVLLDAEKKQEGSAVVRDWIQRVMDTLYEADDLFDEVSTDALLKHQQQLKEDKLLTKVQAFYRNKIKVQASVSKSKPINSYYSIAMKFKAIRKKFDAISRDMIPFQFSPSQSEIQISGSSRWRETQWFDYISGLRERVERPGSFVDERDVIGRDDEKKAILEFLFNKPDVGPSVVAIVGIVGVGKTTLAQLVYNSEEVQNNFNKRWWVCMSGQGFSMSELLDNIFKSMRSAENCLLVLDDVLDSNTSLYFEIIPVLRMGAVGSKVIVTTRSTSIAKDTMCADQIYQLNGLRKESSWQLFKMLAFQFQPELENDPHWISLGREIVERCDNVPLSIKIVASYLRRKATMQEWVSFKNDKVRFDDCILSTPRISYDSLLPILKQCFAYCSLFPKAYAFGKEELIYLWIAQGYLNSGSDDETLETTGHRYFRELLNGSLVQDAKVHECEESLSYSMHDLIHHLAVNVARDETTILTKGLCLFHRNIRHVSVGYAIDNSWSVPLSMVDAGRIRSFLFLYEGSLSPLALDKLLTKFRFMRALNLGHQKIGVVPSSIGELKYLRCLNLSHNKFMHLPDSVIKLVNLLTLDISWCEQLELLPDEFRKLISLRHLDTRGCYRLSHMPPGLEELTSLQRLSYFTVGKAVDARSSSLDALARLELNGELEIMFDGKIDDVDQEECWELPRNISVLNIKSYPGMRIPHLKTTVDPILPYLVRLYVGPSSTLKHLSPFRCLPRLETLHLSNLFELEYIDANESIQSAETITSDAVFFPSLKSLTLERLPKLKGWSTEVEEELHSLHLLSKLTVRCCLELKSMPLCPHLQTLELNDINEKLVQLLLSPNFYSPSSYLATITIWDCDLLKTFPGETLKSLKHLELRFCDNLKNLYLAPTESNVLEQLVIQRCPELDLWGKKWGVDWDSLPNLNKLTVIGMPNPRKLPDCLQQSQAQGKLLIDTETQNKKYKIPGLTPGGDIGIRTKGNPKIKVQSKDKSDLIFPMHKSPSTMEIERNNALAESERLRVFTDFTLSEIAEATNNFNRSRQIGEGDFGKTYRGLLGHIEVAIKVLCPKNLRGLKNFKQEVDVLSKLRHPNIVTLVGVCNEAPAIIYEYLPNGSLEDRLACKNNTPPLLWKTRIQIAVELCSVLVFLHSSQPESIIHGNLKPANILLDAHLSCKLSDFRICQTIRNRNFACYMDRQFMSTGILTPKSDVYFLGVILLCLLTGRSPCSTVSFSLEMRDILRQIKWQVQDAMDKGDLRAGLDPSAGEWPLVQAKQLAILALDCCQSETINRPDLVEQVWRVLEPMKVFCYK